MTTFHTSTSNLFSPAKAEELAASLNATEEEGWTYRVQHVPNGRGKSKIAVYDETETFVGYF